MAPRHFTLNNCTEHSPSWLAKSSLASQTIPPGDLLWIQWTRNGGLPVFSSLRVTLSYWQHVAKQPIYWRSGVYFKVKFTLEKRMKDLRKIEVQLRSFFNIGARLGGWSAPRPSSFTPGNDPVPILQEGGPQDQSGWMRKISLSQDSIPEPSSL